MDKAMRKDCRVVSFRCHGLGDQDAILITKLIRSRPLISSVDVSYNYMSDVGVSHVIGLAYSTDIVSVNISRNNFSKHTVKMIELLPEDIKEKVVF